MKSGIGFVMRKSSGRPSHEGRGLKFKNPGLVTITQSRPSHEGRGLKSSVYALHIAEGYVAPHTRGVD